MVGIHAIFMGVFSLGFIVNFLSKPCITGFTSAVALIIGLESISKFIGSRFYSKRSNTNNLIEDIWLTNYSTPPTDMQQSSEALP